MEKKEVFNKVLNHMINKEGGGKHEQPPVYRPFSEQDKKRLIGIIVDEIDDIDSSLRDNPHVNQFIGEVENILHDLRDAAVPNTLFESKELVQSLEEIENSIANFNIFSLQPIMPDIAEIKTFCRDHIKIALRRAWETQLFFLDQELRQESDPNVKARLLRDRNTLAERISHQQGKSIQKTTAPLVRGLSSNKLSDLPYAHSHSEVATVFLHGTSTPFSPPNETPSSSPKEKSPTRAPLPPILMPEPQLKPGHSPKEPPLPSIFNTGIWRKRVLTSIAVVAGFFGVKMGFEKANEVVNGNIKAASNAFHYLNGDVAETMAKVGRVPFNQEHKELSDKEEREPLTRTYTVQPADTLWGYAEKLIQSLDVYDVDGTITLETVKKLREANDIQGDAAKSKKMWVGATIDVTSAYDFVASQKENAALEEPDQNSSSSRSDSSLTQEAVSSPDAIHAQISPELAQHFSPDLLTSSLTHFGETVFSRSHDILTHIDVKPNVARSAVLSAIVLKDSHKTEAEAHRVKYAGHKKFDTAKDTLDFTRAAQAALDLKNGMSPGEVAKKYGVADVYSKLRDR